MDYKIYPSLLDSFHWYKRSAEFRDDGGAELQELLARINREKREESEEMKKGIILDEFLRRPDFKREQLLTDVFYMGIELEQNFKKEVLRFMSNYVKFGVSQVYAECPIKTKYGDVLLYGLVDFVKGDRAIDTKYVKNYDLSKWYDSWQRLVYPYILRGSGMAAPEYFEFLGTDGSVIFLETYDYKPELHPAVIQAGVEEFIEFLNKHRDKITDKKIFGHEGNKANKEREASQEEAEIAKWLVSQAK